MTDEEREVKSKFKEVSVKERTCQGFKVFSLGHNGTVYVGCGLPLHHEHEEAGEHDENVFIEHHYAAQTDPDGARVIFTWPL